MGSLESLLRRLMVQLSRLLDPLVDGLDRLHFAVEQQLMGVGVPAAWRSSVIAVLWAVVLLVVARWLTGWARAIFLVCVAVVLGRVYGFLPSF